MSTTERIHFHVPTKKEALTNTGGDKASICEVCDKTIYLVPGTHTWLTEEEMEEDPPFFTDEELGTAVDAATAGDKYMNEILVNGMIFASLQEHPNNLAFKVEVIYDDNQQATNQLHVWVPRILKSRYRLTIEMDPEDGSTD